MTETIRPRSREQERPLAKLKRETLAACREYVATKGVELTDADIEQIRSKYQVDDWNAAMKVEVELQELARRRLELAPIDPGIRAACEELVSYIDAEGWNPRAWIAVQCATLGAKHWWDSRGPTGKDMAVLSLLAGNWPDAEARTPNEVMRAEQRAIRYHSKPIDLRG